LLDGYKVKNIEYHSLMTRQAGRRKFVSVHLLTPGAWNVQKGHDLAEEVEAQIRRLFPEYDITVFTHMEPVEDPVSMLDIGIDRKMP
jgi:divalent metal cation (Fe/Co/Zn/Cd) transporter